MSVMESLSYRSIVVASQRTSWFLSQLLRVRYSISAHRPAGLFERDSECCLILAPTHRTILDPWLLASALPYRCARALIPLRPLATQTFSGPLRFFKTIIKAIYWLGGVIQLPPEDNGDGTLPEKLQGLLERLRQGDVVMSSQRERSGRSESHLSGSSPPGWSTSTGSRARRSCQSRYG
jgi:hypothetical protein